MLFGTDSDDNTSLRLALTCLLAFLRTVLVAMEVVVEVVSVLVVVVVVVEVIVLVLSFGREPSSGGEAVPWLWLLCELAAVFGLLLG